MDAGAVALDDATDHWSDDDFSVVPHLGAVTSIQAFLRV